MTIKQPTTRSSEAQVGLIGLRTATRVLVMALTMLFLLAQADVAQAKPWWQSLYEWYSGAKTAKGAHDTATDPVSIAINKRMDRVNRAINNLNEQYQDTNEDLVATYGQLDGVNLIDPDDYDQGKIDELLDYVDRGPNRDFVEQGIRNLRQMRRDRRRLRKALNELRKHGRIQLLRDAGSTIDPTPIGSVIPETGINPDHILTADDKDLVQQYDPEPAHVGGGEIPPQGGGSTVSGSRGPQSGSNASVAVEVDYLRAVDGNSSGASQPSGHVSDRPDSRAGDSTPQDRPAADSRSTGQPKDLISAPRKQSDDRSSNPRSQGRTTNDNGARAADRPAAARPDKTLASRVSPSDRARRTIEIPEDFDPNHSAQGTRDTDSPASHSPAAAARKSKPAIVWEESPRRAAGNQRGGSRKSSRPVERFTPGWQPRVAGSSHDHGTATASTHGVRPYVEPAHHSEPVKPAKDYGSIAQDLNSQLAARDRQIAAQQAAAARAAAEQAAADRAAAERAARQRPQATTYYVPSQRPQASTYYVPRQPQTRSITRPLARRQSSSYSGGYTTGRRTYGKSGGGERRQAVRSWARGQGRQVLGNLARQAARGGYGRSGYSGGRSFRGGSSRGHGHH